MVSVFIFLCVYFVYLRVFFIRMLFMGMIIQLKIGNNETITILFFFLSPVRPLLVEILEREQPLSVGRETEIACRAVGARPPAVITWWLDDRQLQVVEDQKVSKSLFVFLAKRL